MRRLAAIPTGVFAAYFGWVSVTCWQDALDAHSRLQYAIAHDFVTTEFMGDVGFGLLLTTSSLALAALAVLIVRD